MFSPKDLTMTFAILTAIALATVFAAVFLFDLRRARRADRFLREQELTLQREQIDEAQRRYEDEKERERERRWSDENRREEDAIRSTAGGGTGGYIVLYLSAEERPL